jgi:hypothetical protein
VSAGGFAAVLVYQYVDVGAIGPLPNMYDPGQYPEKTLSTGTGKGAAAPPEKQLAPREKMSPAPLTVAHRVQRVPGPMPLGTRPC